VNAGFGVYIHWPYCARICPYCDFNVYRARGRDSAPLLNAIIADIRAHAGRLGRRAVDTVFLGGGTPSLLRGDEVAALVGAVADSFGLAADAEISLEANPEDRALFAGHVAAGVNRLSVGVQALDDAALHALGRAHDAAGGIAAVEAAHATGARVSLDLIYAREGQGVDAWRAELRRALALPAEHLSLYQLTLEPGTAFARAASRGRLSPPNADGAAALYEATQEECERAGAPAYEISNHARGDAARARHNVLYWRGGDWIGVGPGAHGRLPLDGARTATTAPDRPEAYIAAVLARGVGWGEATALTPTEAADEALLMGLRLSEGVDVASMARKRGAPFDAPVIEGLVRKGLVTAEAGRLALTARGRLVADAVVAALA
jgi:oxygen-independent coproporphyrinogen-3 oxidase